MTPFVPRVVGVARGPEGSVIHFEDYGERQQFYLVLSDADVSVGMEITESFLMLHARSIGYIRRDKEAPLGWTAFFRTTKEEFKDVDILKALGWMWEKISSHYPGYVSVAKNGGSKS